MAKNRLEFDIVSEHKPVADFYVADRAVLFEKNWLDIVELIHRSGKDVKGLEHEKINEIFAEELEEADH